MKIPRIKETIFFDEDRIVEVRSRPAWVTILEFWFLWVHEFTCHGPLHLSIPTGNKDYWGDNGFEAAFHVFYTWTLNYDFRIDRSEKLARKEGK